jgi:lipoprotein-anchoring transpeptidase ErfK/SrfK
MQTEGNALHISVLEQRLTLETSDGHRRSYPISTSRFGVGSEEGSQKTPVGTFRIAEKIGADAPPGTVFKNREAVVLKPEHAPGEDLLMSRILWLDGLESDNANTKDRYIYIHGTNDEERIGQPASHGCIRMRNADRVELFALVDVETPVRIEI